jgi:hypothetical protein
VNQSRWGNLKRLAIRAPLAAGTAKRGIALTAVRQPRMLGENPKARPL